MEFDEYDYLEKTVENPDFSKEVNGDGGRSGGEERDYSRGSKRRSNEDSHGYDYVRKKSRENEEERDRGDKDRGVRKSGYRSPSEHRSQNRDRERDREKVRFDEERVHRDHERGNKDRDKDKNEKDSRDRDRSSNEKERERIRDKERHRERERSRGKSRESDRRMDKERVRERDREREARREREGSHQDREARKEREGSHRDREAQREVEGSHRSRDQEREPRERRERKEELAPAEPEADPERDQRTVFAYQIGLKADERDVYEFFSHAGKVRDVRLIMDRNSRRSKGVGYIEFYDAMSVPIAIAMSGQLLLGQPVMVKPSEAEKNLVQSTASAAGGAGQYPGGARRLYVGNLHFNITEDQLRQVFEPFGPVELVQLPTDPETGLCKGFGFVQYQKLEDARAAQQALNGVLELVGRPIKVSAVSDQYGMQDMGLAPGDLDDDEGGGLALNARSRALLMQKLDRSGTATGAVGAVAPFPITALSLGLADATTGIAQAVAPLVSNPVMGQALPGMNLAGIHSPGLAASGLAPVAEPIGVPSEYLQLNNMFDPETETEPDFDLDIKDDVKEECSKFGVVKHIYVDKDSS